MHFTDPKELGGLHVIDRRAASPAGHTGGARRTVLHKYALSPAKQMS